MVLMWQSFGRYSWRPSSVPPKALRPRAPSPAHLHAMAGLLVIGAALLKSAQFPLPRLAAGGDGDADARLRPAPCRHHQCRRLSGAALRRSHGCCRRPSLDLLAIVGGLTALFGSVVMLTQTSRQGLAGLVDHRPDGLHAAAMRPRRLLLGPAAHRRPLALQGARVPLLGQRHRPRPRVLVAEPRRPAALGAPRAGDDGRARRDPGRGDAVRGQPDRAAGRVRAGRDHAVRTGPPDRPGHRRAAERLCHRPDPPRRRAARGRLLHPAARRRVRGRGLAAADTALRGPLDLAIVVLVVLAFGALTILQNFLARHAGEPRWQALYVHLANGLYVNTLANRLVLRFWPSGPARTAGAASPELGATS